MSAKYSADFVAAVRSLRERSLGQELATLCVDGNLPAAYVAQVLGVSRMALHAWFRGSPIRRHRLPRVHTFMQIVKDDLQRGTLPVRELKQAYDYLQEMCDGPLEKINTSANV